MIPLIEYVNERATHLLISDKVEKCTPGYSIHIPKVIKIGLPFGRLRDAEMALKRLMELDVDWNNPVEELLRLFPNEGDITKFFSEHLQW